MSELPPVVESVTLNGPELRPITKSSVQVLDDLEEALVREQADAIKDRENAKAVMHAAGERARTAALKLLVIRQIG